MDITISGNDIILRDDEGRIVEEYTVEGCPWDDLGMCRGCPTCAYGNDYYGSDDDDPLP